MGTATEIPKPPAEKVKFLEDMDTSEAEKAARLAEGLPAGLANMGNTCYMNATLEVLRGIPELKEELMKVVSQPGDVQRQLAVRFRDTLRNLERGDTYTPYDFFETLKQLFPQFAHTDPQGRPTQQDADECMNEILKVLAATMKPGSGSEDNAIDRVFGFEETTTLVCKDNPEEPKQVSTSSARKLPCHIRSPMSQMMEGLKSAYQEVIVKSSPSLGRDAQYEKIIRISKLSAYLQIQFVRFEWKGGKGVTHAKILRAMHYPMILDVYDLCTEELQTQLRAKRQSLDGVEEIPKLSPVQCVDTGYYELFAVLTHHGREAGSGHYIAWVKEREDRWLKFDDDNVTPQNEQQILALSGGGDWHSAYLVFYRAVPSNRVSKPKKPAAGSA
eukprot:TRINITY_DN4055_c0_g1_i1.p1 TRINITY_DN4055_c0_g1~~TRINITY_DN4055_c0_g1_i1.p1  ORF type:complete len:387 (+),score=81.30 TRINITY_DN4055_c0_g1_i1:378-1538(+)